MNLAGVYPILPTPFTNAGDLDLDSLRRLIDFQIEVGVQGVAILGFMGEAHKLSASERGTVVKTVVEQAQGKIDTCVGVRAFGTMGAVEQTRVAETLGADAVFVAPIGIQNDDALYEHYKMVAQSANIPVMIHDFPGSYMTTISAELVARLGRDGLIPYIKLEDPPTLPTLSKIRELSDDCVGIFGGLGGVYFLEELQRGAAGIMTGLAFPEILVRIYQLFSKGDLDGAAKTFDHYIPFIRYEFQPKIGLAYRKYIYQKRGIFNTSYVRPPGMKLDAYTAQELTNMIERVGLSLEKQGIQEIE